MTLESAGARDPYGAIFRFGLFFLPFDNLVFAPSNGWASICPFVFGLYFGLHFLYRPVFTRRALVLLGLLVAVVAYSLGWSALNAARVSDIVDGTFTLLLGMLFYLSLLIRYKRFRAPIQADIEVVVKGYIVAFGYGLVQYVALNFVQPLTALFSLLQKRTYTRLQFSFTEPSFISIHVLGILYVLSHLSPSSHQKRRIFVLMVAFALVSLGAWASTRFAIDLLVFLTILFVMGVFDVGKTTVQRLVRISLIVGIIAALVELSVVLLSADVIGARGLKIIEGGLYADYSLASRVFRINASLKAWGLDPTLFLFGNGFGGSINAMLTGFRDALAEYQSTYVTEIMGILGGGDTRVFSLPIRLVNEFGIVLTGLVLLALVVKASEHPTKLKVVFVSLWLLLQFDSYAHPLLWLMIYFVFDTSCPRPGPRARRSASPYPALPKSV